VEVVTYS